MYKNWIFVFKSLEFDNMKILILSSGFMISQATQLYTCFSCLAACCGDAALVKRLCVESRREVETCCQPAGSLTGGHVLDDVLTERARAQINQSEAVCWTEGLSGCERYKRRKNGIWWVSRCCVTLRILRLLGASQAYELEWNKCCGTQILVCLRRKRKQSRKEEKLHTVHLHSVTVE